MHLIRCEDAEILLPFLHDADEDDDRIRAACTQHTAYLAAVEGKNIGAAVMNWNGDESELIYIGVRAAQRGKGYGKAIITALFDEARERQVKSVLVGTADAGLQTITFYMKCGFRMDSVRKDYFAYFKAPIYENGIPIRDMLVLRYVVD